MQGRAWALPARRSARARRPLCWHHLAALSLPEPCQAARSSRTGVRTALRTSSETGTTGPSTSYNERSQHADEGVKTSLRRVRMAQHAPAGPDTRDDREALHFEPVADPPSHVPRPSLPISHSASPASASPYVPGGWSRAFRAKLRSSAVAKRSPRGRDSVEDEGHPVSSAEGWPPTTGVTEEEDGQTSLKGKILHVRTGVPRPTVSKGVSTGKDWYGPCLKVGNTQT